MMDQSIDLCLFFFLFKGLIPLVLCLVAIMLSVLFLRASAAGTVAQIVASIGSFLIYMWQPVVNPLVTLLTIRPYRREARLLLVRARSLWRSALLFTKGVMVAETNSSIPPAERN
jgi:hypothetical protein